MKLFSKIYFFLPSSNIYIDETHRSRAIPNAS